MNDQPKPTDAGKASKHGNDGTTFKREGAEPAEHDTGRDVDEMNRKAEESLIRNVEPHESVD